MSQTSLWTSQAIPVLPMLARAGEAGDLHGHGWAMEMKWDGIRAIAEVEDGRSRLWSRNGIDITHEFPEVGQELSRGAVEQAAHLDGELVVFDSAGHPNFELVQLRRGQGSTAGALQAHFMVFDVMAFAGSSTINRRYDERRELLHQQVREGEFVHVPPAVGHEFVFAMSQSLALGLEGVVAKRQDSGYTPGRRSNEWIKIKHVHTQEAVVGGWLAGRGRRSDSVGSLLLGVPSRESKLEYIGRVGTGLSDRELQAIAMLARESAASASPFVEVPSEVQAQAHWLEPRLVCEVQHSGWTGAHRLRHPTWRGWRFDKQPDEVALEV